MTGAAKNVIVVANPKAGRFGGRRVADAVRHLEALGVRVSVRETLRRGDGEALARAAANERPDAIVAAGGDGTINEVINGLAYSGVPLGILPLGTANVFAREVGIRPDVGLAAQTIASGRVENAHLGVANGRHFLLMAGVGFDAQVIYRLDLGLKASLGKLAYLLTGLKVLAAPPKQRLEVHVDGETIEAYAAIVGNARYYGGRFQATPLAGIHLPVLDVCLFTRGDSLSLLRYAVGIASGRHVGFPDVVYRKGRDVRIDSAKPLPVQTDGDLAGATPVDLSVAEDALAVLVPTGKSL